MYGGMYCNSIKLSSLDKQRVYPKPHCISYAIRWAFSGSVLTLGTNTTHCEPTDTNLSCTRVFSITPRIRMGMRYSLVVYLCVKIQSNYSFRATKYTAKRAGISAETIVKPGNSPTALVFGCEVGIGSLVQL